MLIRNFDLYLCHAIKQKEKNEVMHLQNELNYISEKLNETQRKIIRKNDFIGDYLSKYTVNKIKEDVKELESEKQTLEKIHELLTMNNY